MRLELNAPHHLSKLHDELLAQVPSVQSQSDTAVMTISGDGQSLAIEVPDDADEAAIRQVIAAHDPSPPAPPAEETSRQRLRELKAKGWSNLTASEKSEVAQRVLEAFA